MLEQIFKEIMPKLFLNLIFKISTHPRISTNSKKKEKRSTHGCYIQNVENKTKTNS